MATKYDLRLLEASAARRESAGLAFDRRAFLKAASLPCLAACAAAAMGGRNAVPLFAAPLAEDDSQFVKEAKFYEKQPYRKTKCKLCPREMRDRRPGARLLRRARESRRHLLHPGAFARGDGAHRSHREEAFLSFSPRHRGLLPRHRRLQRELQDVPELGYLPGAP